MFKLFRRQPWPVKLGALVVWWALWYLTWRFGPWSRVKDESDG